MFIMSSVEIITEQDPQYEIKKVTETKKKNVTIKHHTIEVKTEPVQHTDENAYAYASANVSSCVYLYGQLGQGC